MTTNPLRLTAAAGALLALTVPAAAQATSLVYRDGNDVWVSNLDGTQKRQVTTDGTGARPYDLPTSDDTGTVYAVRGDDLEIRPIKGTAATKGLPFPAEALDAPIRDAEVSPDGKAFGFVYDEEDGATLGQVNPTSAALALTLRTGTITRASLYKGRWMVAVPSGSGGSEILSQKTGGGFEDFLAAPEGLLAAELSRNAKRILVAQGDGEVELIDTNSAAPPYTNPVGSCIVSGAADDRYSPDLRISVSADGSRIAWSNGEGVRIAKAPTSYENNEPCALTDVKLISATGGQPSFSEGPTGYTPPPEPTPTPTTTPTVVPTTSPTVTPTVTATATPSKPTAKLSVAATSRKTALKKGLTVRIANGAAAAKVAVKVRKGSKTLGAGTIKLDGAGSGSVRVKLASSAKRVLKKGRKTKLTVTAGTLTASVTVR